MTTEELRAAFLNTKLYEKGKVNLMYCEVERGIAGFAVPTTKPLGLPAGKELASDYFCERRELGILNIGGAGTVTVDGKKYALRPLDVLYVGKGAKKVLLPRTRSIPRSSSSSRTRTTAISARSRTATCARSTSSFSPASATVASS